MQKWEKEARQPCFESNFVLDFKRNYACTDEVKIKFYETFILHIDPLIIKLKCKFLKPLKLSQTLTE